MTLFFAAHADTIIVVESAFFIVAASVNAVDDLRREPFGKGNEHSTRRRLTLFLAWLVALIALIAMYICASHYASPRIKLLARFTSLYCISAITVRDSWRKKTRTGYAVAIAFIVVVVLTAYFMVLGPLPE